MLGLLEFSDPASVGNVTLGSKLEGKDFQETLAGGNAYRFGFSLRISFSSRRPYST